MKQPHVITWSIVDNPPLSVSRKLYFCPDAHRHKHVRAHTGEHIPTSEERAWHHDLFMCLCPFVLYILHVTKGYIQNIIHVFPAVLKSLQRLSRYQYASLLLVPRISKLETEQSAVKPLYCGTNSHISVWEADTLSGLKIIIQS